MSLILYTNPMSRGRIVRWALEETGAPYEAKIVEYGPEMKGAEFCALNPMGKIPVLSHDGTIVTETPAIVAYLADAFPASNLAPPVNSPLRGPYYRWLFFCAGPLEAAITDKSLNVEVPREKMGFVGYGSLALALDVVEKAVGAAPYLLGSAFSAADIYLASHLNFNMMFGNIEPRPAFTDYVARMMSRPAAQRATAQDDALMPPAQT
jgi:glutathione S-transferase